MTLATDSRGRPAEERIRAAYEAFHRRDIEGILAHFHEDVVWVHPQGMADVGLGGAKHGHAGMREFLAQVPARLGGMRLRPAEFLVQDNRVVVFGTREVKALDGRTAELKFVHSWTLGEDGRAVHFEDYFDTRAMRELIDATPDSGSAQ
jgi:ketosteroid isomerase-like protein